MKKILSVLLLLAQSQSFASVPCGLTGSIEERLMNCNFRKGNFALVSRNEDGEQIWKDLKSQKVWSGLTFKTRSMPKAKRTCSAFATRFSGIAWTLPTLSILKRLTAHGAIQDLENFDSDIAYWSTSINNEFSNYGQKIYFPKKGHITVQGGDEDVDYEFAQNNYKCVGNIINP